ncbi:2-nitropropane dioxygenase family [Dorcoceras hygrometricum]|uniref:2-nitropropane dioxygenase family n=1 Tax=Dorcoceras hygrometricum TaxID=472368 RepID=A0A2Z7A7Y3_9LAMI|nr:2-nitropropane dioxygenase family [Dorcoceras hygrometricum]
MASLTERFGIELPLVQAPMAGASTPELVAAVSNAGGLGSLGAGYAEPQAILDQAAKVRALTDRPFALNLLPARWAPRFSEQFAALCEARPAVASFAFDLPAPAQMRELKRRGISVVGTATTAAEARAWAEHGADAVSVQGAEAGGHRGGFLHAGETPLIGLFALIPLAVRALAACGREIPVVAAGGIMDGAGMLAAEVLGAAASQLGTAFLACPESSAAEAWKRDLATAEDHRVATIRSFSGRAARGLRNRYVAAMEEAVDELPPYPVLNALTAPLRRAAAAAGRADLLSEWCGQAAALVRPQPAAELVARLMHEYRLARRALTPH